MERIGSVRCKKFQWDCMAQTCALIGPVQPILHRVLCSNETLPNAPKHYEMLQNMSLVPMGWIGCVRCEKLRCDFVAQTSALIAPVHPVLNRVSCSNETNPKCTQTVQNGVGRVHSLLKIPMHLNGTNLCINCTSSAQFAPSSV